MASDQVYNCHEISALVFRLNYTGHRHYTFPQGACKEYNYDSYSRLIVDDKDEKQDVAQGISAFINGSPGAAAARKKGGARKPGVPRFRKKRRKKRRPTREDEEAEAEAEGLRRGISELSLEKGAQPKLAPQAPPPTGQTTRIR